MQSSDCSLILIDRFTLQSDHRMPRVVVIGAGPVGLTLAYLLHQKGFQVSVVENRSEYTREQMLVLTPASVAILPKPVSDALFILEGHPACFVISGNKDFRGICWEDKTGTLGASVAARLLEDYLFSYITRELGITVIRPRNARQELTWKYSENQKGQGSIDVFLRDSGGNSSSSSSSSSVGAETFHRLPCDLIIGCDGDHSQVRDLLCIGTYPVPFREPQHAIIFILDDVAIRTVPYRKGISEQLQSKEEQNFFRFFRGKTNSFLAFAADVEDYETCKHAKKVSDLPHLMQQRLQNFLHLYGITRAPAQVVKRVSVFPIQLFKASRFSGMLRRTMGFLAGNSTASVHFFSGLGLNIGLRCASELAGILSTSPIHEWFGRYYSFCEREIQTAMREAIHVSLPFSCIRSSCQRKNLEDLRREAERRFGISLDHLDRLELCLLLSRT